MKEISIVLYVFGVFLLTNCFENRKKNNEPSILKEDDFLVFKKRTGSEAETKLTKEFVRRISQEAKDEIKKEGVKKTKTSTKNFVSHLTMKEVEILCNKNLMSEFRYPEIIPLILERSIRGINSTTCLLSIPSISKKGVLNSFSIEQIKNLRPDAFFEMKGNDLEKLGEKVKYVSNSVWRTIIVNLKCKNLPASCLNQNNPKKLCEITSECFSNLSGLETIVLKPGIIRTLSDDVFSLINRKISPSIFKGMKKEHVRFFGVKIEKEEQKTFLNLFFLNKEVLSEITPTQFANFLNGNNGPIKLGNERISKLGKNILSTCKEKEFQKIDQSDLKFYGFRLEKMKPRNCALFLYRGHIELIKNFNPSSECISYFSPDVLIKFLEYRSGNLSKDSLHLLNKESVSYLKFRGSEGIDVFSYLNIPGDVMKGLGKEVFSIQHPCTLISDYKTFKETKWISYGLGSSCLKVFPFYRELTSFDYQNFPVESFTTLPGKDIERLLIPNYIGCLRKKHIQMMVMSHGFCQQMSKLLFLEIEKSLYSEFTPECISKFSFLSSLNENNFKYLRKDAFKKLDLHNSINFSLLKPYHFQELGTEKDGSVCFRLNGDSLSLLNSEQLNNINKKCLDSIPGSSWEKLKKDQFKNFTLRTFQLLPKTAIENIHSSVLSLITIKQISVLGRGCEVKEDTELPCHALIERSKEIGKEEEIRKYCKKLNNKKGFF